LNKINLKAFVGLGDFATLQNFFAFFGVKKWYCWFCL